MHFRDTLECPDILELLIEKGQGELDLPTDVSNVQCQFVGERGIFAFVSFLSLLPLTLTLHTTPWALQANTSELKPNSCPC